MSRKIEEAKTVNILGIPVHRIGMKQAVEGIITGLITGEGGRRDIAPGDSALLHVVTVNPEMIIGAQRDPSLHRIICRAELVVPDGIGVVLAARIMGQPVPERVAGIDLMVNLLSESVHAGEEKDLRAYFLGGYPGVAERAADRLRRMLPGVNIVGAHHGYFDRSEEKQVLKELERLAPDLLFVGLGVPRQEKWIAANRDSLPVGVVMGVGGSFDVLAGKKKRAPGWMQRLGMEWLYRFLQEPHRAFRMLALPQFVLRLIADLLLGKLRRKG